MSARISPGQKPGLIRSCANVVPADAGTHFWTRGSSPRAPAFLNLASLGKKSGRSYPRNQNRAAESWTRRRSLFCSRNRDQCLRQPDDTGSSSNVGTARRLVSRTRDEVERISHSRVCNNRNRRRVSATGMARLNYCVIARDPCCAAKTPSKSASARKRRRRLHARIELSAICDLIWTGYDARKGDEKRRAGAKTGRAATLKGGVKCEIPARL